ncbi:hypothetical protein M758_12G087400 [Ceratodon purpureus]|nr:hypothetical protein M758_12G087400 [Ceratodon purpureus]
MAKAKKPVCKFLQHSNYTASEISTLSNLPDTTMETYSTNEHSLTRSETSKKLMTTSTWQRNGRSDTKNAAPVTTESETQNSADLIIEQDEPEHVQAHPSALNTISIPPKKTSHYHHDAATQQNSFRKNHYPETTQTTSHPASSTKPSPPTSLPTPISPTPKPLSKQRSQVRHLDSTISTST